MSIAKRMIVVLTVMLVVLGTTTSVFSKTLTIKLQSHLIPADVERTMGPFRDQVAKLSDGQIKIKLFSGSSLFPMKEVLEAVGNGALDMAMVAEGYYHAKVPVCEVAGGLPFSFHNITEAKYFMYKKGFGDLLKQEYGKHNVYHIPYEPFPVGLMTNKPIMKTEDIKGMKLRAYGTMAEWLTQMGASTTYIPGGELYTALATGVVDGAHWGDAGPMYIMKFQEVLKNYMIPEPIVGSWNNLIINADLWNKLTPVQQAIIETAATAMGSTMSLDDTRITSEVALKNMAGQWNVSVNMVPDAEQETMLQAAMKVWDKVAKKDPVNAKAIEMMKDFLKELGHLK